MLYIIKTESDSYFSQPNYEQNTNPSDFADFEVIDVTSQAEAERELWAAMCEVGESTYDPDEEEDGEENYEEDFDEYVNTHVVGHILPYDPEIHMAATGLEEQRPERVQYLMELKLESAERKLSRLKWLHMQKMEEVAKSMGWLASIEHELCLATLELIKLQESEK